MCIESDHKFSRSKRDTSNTSKSNTFQFKRTATPRNLLKITDIPPQTHNNKNIILYKNTYSNDPVESNNEVSRKLWAKNINTAIKLSLLTLFQVNIADCLGNCFVAFGQLKFQSDNCCFKDLICQWDVYIRCFATKAEIKRGDESSLAARGNFLVHQLINLLAWKISGTFILAENIKTRTTCKARTSLVVE